MTQLDTERQNPYLMCAESGEAPAPRVPRDAGQRKWRDRLTAPIRGRVRWLIVAGFAGCVGALLLVALPLPRAERAVAVTGSGTVPDLLRRHLAAVGTTGVPLTIPGPSKGELDLAKYERRVFSQHGEDGILEKIFELVPASSKFAVEFGAGDGIANSNSRNLIVNHGWNALLMEGDDALARRAADAYHGNARVKAIQAWVYPGNIELLLEDNGVPADMDLISIDIDSNDWYVWRAIHDFRPKVVIIEYNAGFPPPVRAVVDFHPMNYWDSTDYYGASLQSLYELGKKKGYELVYCESNGTNAFFVDRKYFKRFGIADNSPARLYRLPRFGLFGRAPNGKGWPAFDAGICLTERLAFCERQLKIDAFKIEKKFVFGR